MKEQDLRYTINEYSNRMVVSYTLVPKPGRYYSDSILQLHPALGNLKTPGLIKQPRLSTRGKETDGYRGIWESDDRLDFHEILDGQVRRNARSVPIICKKDNLLDIGGGNFILKVTPFWKTYNLSEAEHFYHQPMAVGIICSGALVAEDVVVTAAHFADKTNVKNLCFVFGYVMASPSDAVIRFGREQVYHGVEILCWEYDTDMPGSSGLDWTFVKLDRKVVNREIVKFSKDPAFYEQPVYILGFPCGLPLKYAPGAAIQKIEKHSFLATIDAFSGNSGSPVFSAETHELLGIAVQGQGNWEDFHWTRNGVVSMVYPNYEIKSEGILCIKATAFANKKEIRENSCNSWAKTE